MGCDYLNDDEFIIAFQNCTLSKADFHHADHVRLAFLYVQRYGPNAEQRFLDGILNLATSFGVRDKFHYTITAAWMRIVTAHLEEPASASLVHYRDWIASYPELLRKDLIGAHYSAECLASDAARLGWLEPDRVPLPSPRSPQTVQT